MKSEAFWQAHDTQKGTLVKCYRVQPSVLLDLNRCTTKDHS